MSDETTTDVAAAAWEQLMCALEVLDPLGRVEAVIREKVARDIEAEAARTPRSWDCCQTGFQTAARIARGEAT